MNREICKNCKWFESEDADGFDGYCLRYPNAVPKDDRDRCGEFTEIKDSSELGGEGQ